ncbi:hypothetical protein ACKWPK_24645, partial [Escherichia coli]
MSASSTHPRLTRFGGFFVLRILVYNPQASLNNWHLLRQQRQPMAHDTKLHNSDDSAVFASRCGR